MMKTIKFRGVNDDGTLVYPDKRLFGGLNSGDILQRFSNVEQFIGLQDKNGKDIYEGDIVKWDDMSNGEYWRIAVVKINPDIQFDCSETKIQDNAQSNHCFKFGCFTYTDTDNHLEIIGNIHENPELLN